MIFVTVPLAAAAGGTLAHSQVVGAVRWPKGRILDPTDLAAAHAAGLAELTIARLDPDDIAEDAAATRLAAALAGPGLVPLPAAHGRANLAATTPGILRFDAPRIAALNAIDEAVTLATLAPDARVAAGEIVATIKIIRYAVAAPALAAAIAACAPLSVAAFRPRSIALISTTLPGVSAKALAKTVTVTRRRVEALGSTLIELPTCRHDPAALAARLAQLPPPDHSGYDLLLIAGASATVDRGDVVPAAVVAAGGEVLRLGMPVDPGNLLCLATLAGRPVIGLPGCARSPKRNGFDLVLERLVAGIAVTAADIAQMGAGGLLPETERPQPRSAPARAAPARPNPSSTMPGHVGAIILAAGRSTRMGADPKLLAPWRGRPLIAHVADAIAAAGLPPPVIVLGARATEIRAALGDRSAHYVIAADHAEGMSRSLATGLAAAPPDWTAALICLADMPRIEPETLAALAATPGDIVVPTWHGRRGNPVRLPRRLFAAAMAQSGDTGARALLAVHAATITELPAPSDAIHDDIDTPAALAALRARI